MRRHVRSDRPTHEEIFSLEKGAPLERTQLAMLRGARRALSSLPATPPAIASRVQQIFEDHGGGSNFADFDTKFKVCPPAAHASDCALPPTPAVRCAVGRCLQSAREDSGSESLTAIWATSTRWRTW